MTTLVLSPRFSEDSIALWRAALAAGWQTRRLQRLGEAAELREELGGEEVVVHGETLMAEAVTDALGLALLEPSHDWLPRLPPEHRRREVGLRTLGEARGLLGPVFVKPVDGKDFPAQVHVAAVEVGAHVADDLPVLVAEPVRFGLEVRAFVHARRVVALSAYMRGGQLARADDGSWPLSAAEEAAARGCLEALLADPRVELPPALVIDVGEIEGRGWAVVEANPAWASGLYGADPGAVLGALRGACVPVSEVRPEERRWVRPRTG